MKLEYSDSIASKLVLPIFSALLINQMLMSFGEIFVADWFYSVFLVFATFFVDIIEQARKRANAPMFIILFTGFIVYLVSNLILIEKTGIGFTLENLLYVEGEIIFYASLLISVYWGITHGNMLSQVRAYWKIEGQDVSQRDLYTTEVTQAFSPPSMVIGLRRVLFLGFIEHLTVWYLDFNFFFLIAYWILGFVYIALLQRWGLSINIRSVGLKVSTEYSSLWIKSVLVFLMITMSLSLFMPKDIFTIREGVISRAIVNLLGNVHYGQSQTRQQESLPLDGESVRAGGLLQNDTDLDSPPTLSRWLLLVIFVLQVLIMVVIPSIFIVLFLGFLLYSLIASEYHKLRGLPKVFVLMFLWFKRLFIKERAFNTKTEFLDLTIEKADNQTKQVKKLQSRALFYRLVRLCNAQGLNYKNSFTPYEYERMITEKWPEISDETSQITNDYVSSKYGGIKSNRKQKAKAEEYLRQIGNFFRRVKRESAPKKQEIPRL
ncbi:MAG: DUF4129 domain-containing protein [Firmicutes bacterium]|nr:DUF4129 domain-containing protein [Bacillota bacterium]